MSAELLIIIFGWTMIIASIVFIVTHPKWGDKFEGFVTGSSFAIGLFVYYFWN